MRQRHVLFTFIVWIYAQCCDSWKNKLLLSIEVNDYKNSYIIDNHNVESIYNLCQDLAGQEISLKSSEQTISRMFVEHI